MSLRNSRVAQGQWAPDNATMLGSSRAPAHPTAAAGQRVSALPEGVITGVHSEGPGCRGTFKPFHCL